MIVYLIGVHYNGKTIIGFRLLDHEKQSIMDVPYNNTLDVIKSKKAIVKGIESQGNKLKGSNGVFSRYPKITNGQITENNSIVVIKQVGDAGYIISDWQGNIKTYRNEDILKLMNIMGIANGKIVERENGTKFISAIVGEYDKISLTGEKAKEQSINNVKTEVNKANNIKKLNKEEKQDKPDDKYKGVKLKETALATPKINGNITRQAMEELKEIDNDSGMTVEQKIAKAMLIIRRVRSFYYAILSTIQRIPSTELATMGVSIDSLYYNTEFVKELTMPELVFVGIHEVCHLAMRHRQRKGTRIHSIWNIACDFFINKLICDEFGIKPGDPPVYPIEKDKESGIQFLEGGMYNSKIDITKDTPESIYEELLKQAKQEAGNKQSQPGEGQSEDGSGESSDGGGGSSYNDSDSDSDGQDEQNGEGQDTGDEETGDEDDSDGEGNAKDRLGKISKAVEDVNFRGKKVGKLKIVDIVDDSKSAEMTETQKQNKVRTILERAVVMQKQNTGSFGGEAGGWMERYVEDALAPKIDWRTLVKNKLTLATQKVNTYSAPDRRFLSRNMILPGPKSLENDALENVKVCIDTSGSISDKDLGIAMAQINQLLKVYRASAELLYWDTKVRVCEPFKNIQELVKIKPGGGGGTDVNCVFEEFESRDYKIGKKQKPSIIIIFTDGYFGQIDERHRKYRDTIWVVHDNDSFEPPFGLKAPFRYDEK